MMTVKLMITLTMTGLLATTASGQEVRNDTITDRVHQLREVTITESRRQHEVTSTAPLRILDQKQMLTLGVTDIADALHILYCHYYIHVPESVIGFQKPLHPSNPI